MSTYAQNIRASYLASVRERALARQGITFRLNGEMGAAMVGTKPDGSVWVWDELTESINQVAPAGTVDVDALPVQKTRGRPRAKVVEPLGVEPRSSQVPTLGFS